MNKAEAREILKERIFYGDKQEDLKIIDQAIDYLLTLEEVVRCMDCVHYTNPEIGWCEYHSRTQAVDGSEWTMFDDDDYCSDGEPIRRRKSKCV